MHLGSVHPHDIIRLMEQRLAGEAMASMGILNPANRGQFIMDQITAEYF